MIYPAAQAPSTLSQGAMLQEWPKLGFILEEKHEKRSPDHQFCLTLRKVFLWVHLAFPSYTSLQQESADTSHEFSSQLDTHKPKHSQDQSRCV